ncbi:DEAD/DEAH box helicase [Mycoplasmopsis californica]|uniref:DEAD/DEAH box helicase n=1 Tax=Mycoplasmopsis californica TaxID=2113 RepID=UPI00068C701C|nr:DEAD/DEAH box helicase [Mycoplasmopsis californica]
MECEDYHQAFAIIQENKINVNDYKLRMLKRDFKTSVKKIADDLIVQYQKQSVKWSMFLNRAQEVYEQTNIWPIHIGFMYVKVNIEGKSIYAPLFLKEVNISLDNSKPRLYSISGIKPNEKLLFLLNNANFDVNTSIEPENLSIREFYEALKHNWSKMYPNLAPLNSEFEIQGPEEITNEPLEFCPGVVLGLFQPSGGYIRNRMMEIIKNGEINKIITTEFKKQKYIDNVENFVLHPQKSLFRITPTNFSQDQAIASSLIQNTVIWGPPGTGKSQTIVNLLTNILIYKRTAVVCSQKKAALEVIRNRMGSLKSFCLFMLNTASVNKKAFYKPLKEYLDFIEHFNEDDNLKPLRILSARELKYVSSIADFANDHKFKLIARILPLINDYLPYLNKEKWEFLLSLPSFFTYPSKFGFATLKELQNWLLKTNRLQWNFFTRKRSALIKLSEGIFEHFNGTEINLASLKHIASDMDLTDFEFMNSLLAIIPPENRREINDENEIKKYVSKIIVDRYEQLSPEEKEMYSEFAVTVRIGKTEPYKFINKFANIIKKLFPIIIVTPDVDLSAWSKEEFDYAVLDESSQIFVEQGLPVLYLAKIKVLAGDDQQMKPSSWFEIRVTDDESVYGITLSLLEFVTGLGVHSILLNKNYRSRQAALMTFSSKHFYDSKLDVIDSAEIKDSDVAIEVIEANGHWIDNKNLIEEEIAIDLLQKNLNKYEKIILLCFNSPQQESITKRLFEYHPEIADNLKNNKLLLRNIENIQGDEADLVIATIGYDASAKIHSTFVGRNGGRNALNVAISRAKDKMIVIKSIQSSDIIISKENEDVWTFKKWLEFLELDHKERKEFLNLDIQRTREIELNVTKEKSELFFEIYETLNKHVQQKPWIEVYQDYPLGTFNVDLLVKYNNDNAFAIMVDDYEYANDPKKYLEFKDLNKFIRAKEYKLYVLDRLKWEQIKDDITYQLDSLPIPKVINDSSEDTALTIDGLTNNSLTQITQDDKYDQNNNFSSNDPYLEYIDSPQTPSSKNTFTQVQQTHTQTIEHTQIDTGFTQLNTQNLSNFSFLQSPEMELENDIDTSTIMYSNDDLVSTNTQIEENDSDLILPPPTELLVRENAEKDINNVDLSEFDHSINVLNNSETEKKTSIHLGLIPEKNVIQDQINEVQSANEYLNYENSRFNKNQDENTTSERTENYTLEDSVVQDFDTQQHDLLNNNKSMFEDTNTIVLDSVADDIERKTNEILDDLDNYDFDNKQRTKNHKQFINTHKNTDLTQENTNSSELSLTAELDAMNAVFDEKADTYDNTHKK